MAKQKKMAKQNNAAKKRVVLARYSSGGPNLRSRNNRVTKRLSANRNRISANHDEFFESLISVNTQSESNTENITPEVSETVDRSHVSENSQNDPNNTFEQQVLTYLKEIRIRLDMLDKTSVRTELRISSIESMLKVNRKSTQSVHKLSVNDLKRLFEYGLPVKSQLELGKLHYDLSKEEVLDGVVSVFS